MKILALLALLALLGATGCESHEDQTASTAWANSHRSADLITKQKSRFQFIAASVKYPPMILDTATGCLSSIDLLNEDGVLTLDLAQVTRGGKQIDEACAKIEIVGN